jgi:CBS domain-containing protein
VRHAYEKEKTVILPSSSSTIAVGAAMHRGVINCPPQTPLGDVAALMAEHGVHCVVVDGLAQGPHHDERLVWGIVSDVDLMRAAGSGRLHAEAGEAAASEIVTIGPEEDIECAAQIMGEHDCSHLIVVLPDSGQPLGVISSLDVARALAWGSRQ